jgi:hypothetical protein
LIIEGHNWNAVFTPRLPGASSKHEEPVVLWTEIEDGQIRGVVRRPTGILTPADELHGFAGYRPSNTNAFWVTAEQGWWMLHREEQGTVTRRDRITAWLIETGKNQTSAPAPLEINDGCAPLGTGESCEIAFEPQNA